MSLETIAIKLFALALATHASAPRDLPLDDARTVVALADAAATPDIPAEVLLSMAYIESRYQPKAVSRLVAGKRVTGVYRGNRRPPGSTGNMFCGITQGMAPTWRRCAELQSPNVSLANTVHELEAWGKRTNGNLQRSLQGYGCGNAGLSGACGSYAKRVLRRAARIKQLRIRYEEQLKSCPPPSVAQPTAQTAPTARSLAMVCPTDPS